MISIIICQTNLIHVRENNMKKTIVIILALIICLTLFGCRVGTVRGEVYEKEIKDAHNEQIMVPIFKNDGRGEYVTYKIYIRYYQEEYLVKIRKFDKSQNTYIYNVLYYKDISDYDKVEIGDWVEYSNDTCYNSEPYIQREKNLMVAFWIFHNELSNNTWQPKLISVLLR